jgi:hypothetical protein
MTTCHCHHCGAVIDGPVGFRAACPSCQSYLHCCLNCRLYSPAAHNHCLSPTTDFVRDVAEANFCEEFDPAVKKPGPDPRAAAKSKFDQLFGG